MKRKLLIALLVSLSFSVVSMNGQAATLEEIETAISDGLAWLVLQQQSDGRWEYGEEEGDIATTALALVKLCDRARELGDAENRAIDPFDNNTASPTYYLYADNVINGFSYLFSKVGYDPDEISGRISIFGSVYSTGTAMMAIAASNTPDQIIPVPPLGGPPDFLTYKDALQGMMDWMAYAQNDSSCGIGGWNYVANTQTRADNSNSGYATFGIGFASLNDPIFRYIFDIPVPPEVKTGLETFIANIQVSGGSYDGGSAYNPCDSNLRANILKTGNLLYELGLVGADEDDPRVVRAINFIETYWNNNASSDNGGGWKGDYQAMYLLKKGFAGYKPYANEDGTPTPWFDDVATYIVDNQNAAGYWASTAGVTTPTTIDTAWALLALEPVPPPEPICEEVSIDIKPGSCPNPMRLKCTGVLPAAILGNDKLDVSTIDPDTVMITREGIEGGVPLIRHSYEDVATPFEGELCDCHTLRKDGYMDLTVKFKVGEVVEGLMLDEFEDRETVPLAIVGETYDGTCIRGEDCIWIIGYLKKECQSDLDCDADVDGNDAITFKKNFGRNSLKNPCNNEAPCDGNFDEDSDVDGNDAHIFKSEFGTILR